MSCSSVAPSVHRPSVPPPAQSQPAIEVQPGKGGNMRVHLDSHETFLESLQPVLQGRTTLHIDPSNGLRNPEVRGSNALRVLQQHTHQSPAGAPEMPLFAIKDGAVVPAGGQRGAESTVVVDAGRDTVAVISGQVPVDGSIVVRLMPTGEGSGDEMAYMAQRYVTLANEGNVTLQNISVDLMSPHESVIDSLRDDGQAALAAMLSGDNRPEAPKTYVKYASLAKAITLEPGVLKLPLGEPVVIGLKAEVNAEVADVRPTRSQRKPLSRTINTFANLGIRGAPEELPPARYEILDQDGRLLTSSVQDAIPAKQNAKLGRIPFDKVTGKCEASVAVTDDRNRKGDLTLTATMENTEAVERTLDVMFDLWHVVGVEGMKVFVDGKPVENPKVRLDPAAGLVFVPARVPAACSDGTPGRVELRVVLQAKIETAAEALLAKMGAQSTPAPDSMYT